MIEADLVRLEKGKKLTEAIKTKQAELAEMELSDLLCFTAGGGNYEIRYDRDAGRQSARFALAINIERRKKIFLKYKEEMLALIRAEIHEMQAEFEAL